MIYLVTKFKKDQYLEWLPRLESRKYHHHVVIQRSHKDTRKWLLDHHLRYWKAKQGSFFCLHGKGERIIFSSNFRLLSAHKQWPDLGNRFVLQHHRAYCERGT